MPEVPVGGLDPFSCCRAGKTTSLGHVSRFACPLAFQAWDQPLRRPTFPVPTLTRGALLSPSGAVALCCRLPSQKPAPRAAPMDTQNGG